MRDPGEAAVPKARRHPFWKWDGVFWGYPKLAGCLFQWNMYDLGVSLYQETLYIYTCDTIEDTIYYNTETDRIEYIVCNIVSAALHITLYIVELI